MEKTYLKKAEESFPEFFEEIIIPQVNPTVMSKGNSLVIDLKNLYVGFFAFTLGYVDAYIDAPVRLSVKFCETQRELDDDFSEYNGTLCRSWLQDEVINIDFPEEYAMPRRYSARYIAIKVLEAPTKIMLSEFKFRAVTSADVRSLSECECEDELKKIDSVAVNTLKNCMQGVFEDGPKRDRRLWIGDLRLEALANYYTFRNMSLVRRCLYLFAASSRDIRGFIPACVFEKPRFVSGTWVLMDYSLLYAASVCEYYNHTGDRDTFFDLYPVIKGQLEAMRRLVDSDGIVTTPEGPDVFIDWCNGLKKVTSLHGVYLYVLKLLAEVLEKMKHEDAELYRKRYEHARESAKRVLYDEEKNMFINGRDNYQYSVHSAVWMVLGGTVRGEKAQELLKEVLRSPDSIKPFTPYMHHYVVEALIKLGMQDDACKYIKEYWGSMAGNGADAFYEVHVPGDSEFSPYGDRKVNSMCHAWSCTPTYFIRKYFS